MSEFVNLQVASYLFSSKVHEICKIYHITLRRKLVEKYHENKNIYMVFIDLEKTLAKVPRNVIWWILERKVLLQKGILM